MENENGYIYECVPEGVWSAVYVGVSEDEIPSRKHEGKMEKILRHTWDADVNGRTVRTDCLSDMRPSPFNRFGKIFRVFEGRDIKPQERAPVEKWTGKKATIVVELRNGRSVVANILPPKE